MSLSSPSISYTVKPETVASITSNEDVVQNTRVESPAKNNNIEPLSPKCPEKRINHHTPWPTIIISLIGAGLLMYTAIGPSIPQDRRIFGIVIILLWTLLFALILWVLWKNWQVSISWWLLILGGGVLILFFVIVIILNLGS